MSVPLTTVDGRLAVEIIDHTGEVRTYVVEVLANTPQRFSVRLHKQGAEAPYLVQIGERWHTCDCPAYQYRRVLWSDGCKHIAAARGLRDVLALLADKKESRR